MSIRLDTEDTEWHTALIVWKVTLLCSEDRLTIFLFILHLASLLPLKNKLQNHKTFLDPTKFPSKYCFLSALFLSPVSWESLYACLHHLTSHLLDAVHPGLCSPLHQQSCQAYQWLTCSEFDGHVSVLILLGKSLSYSPINKNVGLCYHSVFQTRLPWLPQPHTLLVFSKPLLPFFPDNKWPLLLWLQLPSVSWWPSVCISLSSQIQKSSCLFYNYTWIRHRHCQLHKPKDECMNWSALPTCPTRPFIPPSSSPPYLVIMFHNSAS